MTTFLRLRWTVFMLAAVNATANDLFTTVSPSEGAVTLPGIIKIEATFVPETVKKAKVELWRQDVSGKKDEKQKLKMEMVMEDATTNHFSVLSPKPLDEGTYCYTIHVEFKTGPIKTFKSDPLCFLVLAQLLGTSDLAPLPVSTPSALPPSNPTKSPLATAQTSSPSSAPNITLSSNPTKSPVATAKTPGPSPSPSTSPSVAPSSAPTESPMAAKRASRPSSSPFASQSVAPSPSPTESPTAAAKTPGPSPSPSTSPSVAPSSAPTESPMAAKRTSRPSSSPFASQSVAPSPSPTESPTAAAKPGPSPSPSTSPSVAPSSDPTKSPMAAERTSRPSSSPSASPPLAPSPSPTESPTAAAKTPRPSPAPSTSPSIAPSPNTTKSWPSATPSAGLTTTPSHSPNKASSNESIQSSSRQQPQGKTIKVQLEAEWKTDSYASEFTFQVTDSHGNVVLEKERSDMTSGYSTAEIESGKIYCFRGTDDYGDGICCGEGEGGFELRIDGRKFMEGGMFRFSTGYHCFTVDDKKTVTSVEAPNTELCEKNDPGKFNMCVEIVDLSKGVLANVGFVDDFEEAFLSAKQTWAGVMTKDDGTDHDVFGYFVDDLYIEAAAASIDGNGSDGVNVLGFAGPGLTWNDQGFTKTFTGYIALDIADMWKMVNDNTLGSVVRHEMAHVLGLGTLWGENNLYMETGQYMGRHANEAYRQILLESGATFDVSESTVPIEEDGGRGTIYVHWDEECLQHEIMTGKINSVNVFSNITLGGLHDLGYSVNYAMAEPYIIPDINNCIQSRRLRGGTSKRGQHRWRQLRGKHVHELDPKKLALATKAGQEFLEKSNIKARGKGVSDFGTKIVDVLFADESDNIFSLFVSHDD
ncbi:hypothetical protein ACA910_007992 [Epithemia clementina (nom. ined.)]